MRNLFFVMAAVMVFTISCVTIPTIDTQVKVTDKNGKNYIVKYVDDTKNRNCKVSIDIKEKTYVCEVDYKEAAPDAAGFDIDFNAFELEGKISVTYKTVKVDCAVENIPVEGEEKAERKSAVEIVEEAADGNDKGDTKEKPEESKEPKEGTSEKAEDKPKDDKEDSEDTED